MDRYSLTRVKPSAKTQARQLRATLTDAERRLWKNLRLRQFGGYKFRRQHPLGCYVVDFVCIEAQLIIEVDGGQHNEKHDYDALRTEWLRQKGFRVIRFWNHEVLHDIEAVKAVIGKALQADTGPPSQPSPLEEEGVEQEP